MLKKIIIQASETGWTACFEHGVDPIGQGSTPEQAVGTLLIKNGLIQYEMRPFSPPDDDPVRSRPANPTTTCLGERK